MAHVGWGSGKVWVVVTLALLMWTYFLKNICGSFVLGSVLNDCTSHVSGRIGLLMWIGLKKSIWAPILMVLFEVFITIGDVRASNSLSLSLTSLSFSS
jgi:hypothetical protein